MIISGPSGSNQLFMRGKSCGNEVNGDTCDALSFIAKTSPFELMEIGQFPLRTIFTTLIVTYVSWRQLTSYFIVRIVPCKLSPHLTALQHILDLSTSSDCHNNGNAGCAPRGLSYKTHRCNKVLINIQLTVEFKAKCNNDK